MLNRACFHTLRWKHGLLLRIPVERQGGTLCDLLEGRASPHTSTGGDIAMMDNMRSHHVKAVEETLRAAEMVHSQILCKHQTAHRIA